MNLTAWLEGKKGRSSALAEHLGVTPAAVSQWKSNGVPVRLMKAVRDFTGGEVTLDAMVPEFRAPPTPEAETAAARAA